MRKQDIGVYAEGIQGVYGPLVCSFLRGVWGGGMGREREEVGDGKGERRSGRWKGEVKRVGMGKEGEGEWG